ncbi:MAG: DUF4395 domain-containing protein [Actinomycetota bacterium]|nr:DUF4395 domain-containing protein [Actinomycetota bacterium]
MPSAPIQVDPRGLRVSAALTAVVLAVVLLTESSWLLAAQAVVFAVGAFAGVQRSPYSRLFVRLVRPRLGPPPATEDSRPPQFAQLVGLIFAVVGLVGFWAGLTILGLVATGFALGAAFLNAALGLCLGCEVYLVIRRVLPGRVTGAVATTGHSA